ncbi:type 2 lanthipeptide synthetase LanM [Arcicella sp. LKC2W]|uniref:type 2 lanthipeptide synthetase LanM n=1 Tax=Arcicella sp. LKC2W TaxID=2984198 RepID=UPI002B220E72|nr:type 2 lanthipeptide synthetase LanM [Arcicella sp. LKC2W]MEA5461121.1 type 2 lanthipeptide synthetase LanM [Arcicella sp. LKC2W]
MEHSSFLKRLYFKSLTPFEILDCSKKVECSYEKNENFDYLDYWKKSISKDGSNNTFEKYCLINNLNPDDLPTMISEVVCLENFIDFPIWINVLDNIMSHITEENIVSTINDNFQKPFYHLFLPYVNYFSKKLNESTLGINKKVVNQLNILLYEDLYNLAYSVLFKEFKTGVLAEGMPEDFYYKKFVLSILDDKYQHLFLKYPMLARKLSEKTHSYCSFVINIYTRFYCDKKELESLFNRKLGEISKLHLNSGDLHNGETTVIIEFDDCFKIVYKPTNVSITKAYNSFITWVNDKIEEKLLTFEILDKQTYGWMEFVENSQCNSISDVKLYYERAGIILGIAYLLNSKDYHYENIIASGNSPVLIDHETILSPALNSVKQETENNISGTVLETSLIPTKKLDLPFFMYGFGSSSLLESTVETLTVKNPNQDKMSIESDFNIKKLYKSNKPIYNDNVENLINYQAEFKQGFQKFYELIVRNKVYLLSPQSPINSFWNSNIRFINRQTKVYHKILKYLNKPEYLSDSLKYGIKLEILARAYTVFDKGAALLTYERKQMLHGDIPVFHIKSLDKDINLPDKKKTNLIKFNAIENIFKKIESFTSEDFDYQMSLISESLTL